MCGHCIIYNVHFVLCCYQLIEEVIIVYNPNMQFIPQFQYNPAPNNGITWVQGIEGAKAYQLQPNSNTVLMDSENDCIFYIKVSDNIGMSSLRVFKYSEVTSVPKETPKPSNEIDLSQYVKKDELQALLTSIMAQENKNEQTVSATQSKSTKSTSH